MAEQKIPHKQVSLVLVEPENLSEDIPPFRVTDRSGRYLTVRPVTAEEVINFSAELLGQRMRHGIEFTSAADTTKYCIAKLSTKEREVFACLFLDNRHKLIAYEELFYGTIDGASVHPREVVKRALYLNAAAVVLSHNHPSCVAEPSRADEHITDRLKAALELIDVRVLDHIVVGGDTAVSFAERGLI